MRVIICIIELRYWYQSTYEYRRPIFSSNKHFYAILYSEMPKITDTVYLDIEIDNVPAGRIVLGLFGQLAPRTAENFKRLCACDAGKGQLSGVDLCYKGTTIHRISKLCVVWGSFVQMKDASFPFIS